MSGFFFNHDCFFPSQITNIKLIQANLKVSCTNGEKIVTSHLTKLINQIIAHVQIVENMKQVYSSIKTNREMMFVVKNSQEIYSTFIPILVSSFRFDMGRTFGLVIFMQVYISQPKPIFSPDFTFILRFLFNITVLNAQLQEGNQHAKTFGRGCFFLSIQSLILLVIFNEGLCM